MKKYFFFLVVLIICGCDDEEIDPYARTFDWASKEESIDFLENNFPSIVIEPLNTLENIPDVVVINDLLIRAKSSSTFSNLSLGLIPLEGAYFKERIISNLSEFQEINMPSGIYNYNQSTEDFDFVSSSSDLVIRFSFNSEPMEVTIQHRKNEDWNYLNQNISITLNTGTGIDNYISWSKQGDDLAFWNFEFLIHSDSLNLRSEAFDHDPERDFRFYTQIYFDAAAKDEFGNVHALVPYECDYYTLGARRHGSFINGSNIDNNFVSSFFEYDMTSDQIVIQLVRYNRDTQEDLKIGEVVNIDGKYVIRFEDESTEEYPFVSQLVDQIKFPYQ